MGESFEEKREGFSKKAGMYWNIGDIGNAVRDGLQSVKPWEQPIPFVNTLATIAWLTCNYLIGKNKPLATMYGQAIAAFGTSAMCVNAVMKHDPTLGIVAWGGLALGNISSSVAGYIDHKKQKKAKANPLQEFKENKASALQRFPQLLPMIPMFTCNLLYFASNVEKLVQNPTSVDNFVSTGLSISWIVGSGYFALSKQTMDEKKTPEKPGPSLKINTGSTPV